MNLVAKINDLKCIILKHSLYFIRKKNFNNFVSMVIGGVTVTVLASLFGVDAIIANYYKNQDATRINNLDKKLFSELQNNKITMGDYCDELTSLGISTNIESLMDVGDEKKGGIESYVRCGDMIKKSNALYENTDKAYEKFFLNKTVGTAMNFIAVMDDLKEFDKNRRSKQYKKYYMLHEFLSHELSIRKESFDGRACNLYRPLKIRND